MTKSSKRMQIVGSFFAAAVVGALTALSQRPAKSAPEPDGAGKDQQEVLREFGNRGIVVHDPSTIIKCKDKFWVFATGRNTPSFYSSDLEHWTRGPFANANPPAWIAQAVPLNSGSDFWAPDIIKVGDRYLLFFAVSSFGKNTSAIGVASNPTLDPTDPAYRWTDGGIAVQSKENDDYNALDPAVFLDDDGRLWLSFGSFWSGIKLIELDPATGRRIAPDSPMYSLAHWDAIEAPYIYKHDGHYYLFVSLGMCCRGVNSTYNTRVGRAEKVTGPYLDKDGKDLLLGGGTIVADTQGPFIGPGHAGIIEDHGKYWFSCHFYDGTTERGISRLSIRPLAWSADGWPVVGQLDAEAKP
jgi:arabinan endo-1,5-alpha-L-arabinosidase